MSFILNALRKSEQERQSILSDPLQDQIKGKPKYIKKKKPLWLIILSLANLFLLFYFIWFFLLKNEPAPGEDKLHISEKTKEIIASKRTIKLEEAVKPKEELIFKQPVILREEANPKIIKPQVVLNTGTVTDKTRIKPGKGEQQISIAQRLENQKKEKVQRKEQVFQPETADSLQAARRENPQPVKRINKPFQVVDRLEKPGRRRNNPPYLSGLSYEFRRTVPKIRINVFVYTESEEDRMIMIDMEKYRVGDEIAEKMELEEIRKNSIVVKYKDKIFQIKR